MQNEHLHHMKFHNHVARSKFQIPDLNSHIPALKYTIYVTGMPKPSLNDTGSQVIPD